MNASTLPSFRRRRVTSAVAGILLLPSAPSANAQVSLAAALNRTARFRALSQRCAKAYCQQYLDVLPDSAKDTIASAQRLVQLGFEELARATFSADIAQQINQTQVESGKLTTLLAVPPTKDGVWQVSEQANKMLVTANKTAELIEALAKQPSAKLVNLAGRQRMLSQRIAKNYNLSVAGYDAKAVKDQIASDKAEFKQSLAALAAAPISTPSIRNELSLGQAQWLFLDTATNRKPDAETLKAVATSSERVLEVMNNLTGLYEAALKDLLGST